MAFTITVGGDDLTSEVRIESVRTEQTAEQMIAVCSFDCMDADASLAIEAKDAVIVQDGATVYFKGEVAGTPERQEFAPNKLLWRVDCQDYNALLDQTVVTSYSAAAGTKSDATIIDDLVSTYRGEGDIDSTSHVTQIVAQANMEAFSVEACSLRQALMKLCGLTGGRFYVDFDKNLYYFATSGTTNSDGLSDSPDGVNTFRYWGLERQKSTGLINAVYIKGKEIEDWRTHAASVASYGSRELAVRDPNIATQDALDQLGDAILQANACEATTYRLKTNHGGFSAGEKVELTSSVYSLSAEAYLILRIATTFNTGSKPEYELLIGDDVINAPVRDAQLRARMVATEIRVSEIDTLTAHGWSHDLTFSATDADTVAWTSGDIYLGGGIAGYSIDAGNTGNMAVTTYIYLDTGTSETVLQTETDVGNTVGADKILIAVANPVAGEAAQFQVFGGIGWGGTFVGADNIAGGVITGDHIAANTVTASNLNVSQLSAITATLGEVTCADGDIEIGDSGIVLKEGESPETIYWKDSSTNLIARLRGWKDSGDGRCVADILGYTDGSYTGRVRLRATSHPSPYTEREWLFDGQDGAIFEGGLQIEQTTYIGDDSNANMSLGLTINQGENDDEIIALKSSDVAHGMTDRTETDTYAALQKVVAASGGVWLRGYTEDEQGVYITGAYTNDNTTKTTAGRAAIVLGASKKSGTTYGNPGADANIVAFLAHATARFIFDEDGDAHADVQWTTYDDHDDMALLETLNGALTDWQLGRDFGEWAGEKRELLERLNIVHFDDENPGHVMLNYVRLPMLNTSAIRQLATHTDARLAALEQKLLTA